MLSTFCAQSEVSQLTAVQEKEREILKEREAAASSTQSLAHVPTIHMSDAPAANDATDVEGAFKRDGETVPSECIPSVIPVHSDEGVTLETVDVQVIDTATAMDLCSMPASPIDHTSQPLLLETLSSEPSLVQNAPSESPFGSVPSSLPSTDVHLYSTELTADILQYWFATEGRFQPQADYLQHQPDLNSKMREILIDWLHEVVSRFRLQTETMFLAVGLLDRFLACKAVGRKKLQLVGCVALLLASKYEEIYTPEINDFLIISDHAYERDHILHMESIMLNSLNFHLTQVTSLRFMQRFMNTPEIDYILQYTRGNGHPMLMCQYLLEMTLQFVKFLEYLPSTVAASCLYIVANHLHINSGASTPFDWSSSLQRETRHTVDAMRPCIQDVYIHWRTLTETAAAALAQGTLASGGPGNKCLAIFRKYGKEAYGQVNQTTFHKPACIN